MTIFKNPPKRCEYPNCASSQYKRGDIPSYCRHHQNRDTWKICECGKAISRDSMACRECSNVIRSREAGTARKPRKRTASNQVIGAWCKPIDDEGMATLRQGRQTWTKLTEDAKAWRIAHARDLVSLGLMTEDQSRMEFPGAWAVIDRRTGANCVEVG